MRAQCLINARAAQQEPPTNVVVYKMSPESDMMRPAPLQPKRSVFRHLERQLLPLSVEDTTSSEPYHAAPQQRLAGEEVPIKLTEMPRDRKVNVAHECHRQPSPTLAARLRPQRGLPPRPRLPSPNFTSESTPNKPLPPSPKSAPALLLVRRNKQLLQEQSLLRAENDNLKKITRHFQQMFEACDAYEKRLTLGLKEVQDINFYHKRKIRELQREFDEYMNKDDLDHNNLL